MTIVQIAWYFLIYSFLGWVVEVVYQALEKGLVVNRGFLNGPVCPIYGFGVVGLFLLMDAVSTRNLQALSLWKIFICGALLATLIELVGGWILDRFFHVRLWDYRDKPFNFRGYICLEFTIIWGLAIVFVVRNAHPVIEDLCGHMMTHHYAFFLMVFLYVLYFADFVVSVFILIGLNKRFEELDEMRRKMRTVSDELSTRIGTGALETAQRVDEAKVQGYLAKAEMRENLDANLEELDVAGRQRIRELQNEMEARRQELEQRKEEFYDTYRRRRHFGYGRLMRAFPKLEHHDHEALLEELKERLRLR